MVAIKNKLNNKSVTPERDENKLNNKSFTLERYDLQARVNDLQACINKLNNIIDKLINEKVVSYSSQHPYSYYSSQRSKAKEDTADPAEDALEKVREEED